ncbi:Multidrug resistance efflux pump [Proteiniborus ethanoligenes]|uniref:Multidrug resistance efflux pump n=1 Tax=Proteiniborus ethanoligenes TaxID=415015 RepID=A0A1H3P9E6_9FIRM|nr:efflux RND transporter periplasmic adaptor subunit [Proteiniborus ethanoligenes]TAH63983.1 MAG: efflux RND transporter periplasmic adaptor subunit [Gottschalkiaceae bacterium]SDY97691.1 Multidrug resistance efflux pump [Proteiniborus ethanoligenes]
MEDTKKTDMRKKKILKAGQIFLITIIILTFTSKSIRNLTLPKVSTMDAKSGSLIVEIATDGIVNAVKRIEHYIDFSATVKEVKASLGDMVVSGDTILVLDKEPLELDLVKKEIALKRLKLQYDKAMAGNVEDVLYTYEQKIKEAETELSKIEEEVKIKDQLYNEGAIAKKELDNAIRQLDLAKLKYENANNDLEKQLEKSDKEKENREREIELMKLDISSAEIEIEELKKMIKNCTVIATSYGTIKEINFKEGMVANNSKPLYILDSPDKGFEAIVTVNNEESQYLETGDSVQVFLKSGNSGALNGEIKSIKDAENTGKKLVTVGLEDDNLKGGEIVEFYMKKPIGSYKYLVPRQALRTDEKGKFVFTLEERQGPLGKEYYVVRNGVTEGDSDNNNVGIFSGLMGGERIIVRSSKPISEGSLVTIE